ncbi:MAG: hypothetical protein C4523_19345 [Myxococcales bacterium]|nr:MAG: hypothetical protein C4523_19345 [Myxococcales bacterium]
MALWGYLFDRYEHDCLADLAELDRLAREALGVSLGLVALSGRPYAELVGAPRPAAAVVLPYADSSRAALIEVLGEGRVASAPLPIGVIGTSLWLNSLAAALGKDPRPLDAFLARERQLLPSLQRARGKLAPQLAAAVAADAPLAAALVGVLAELGVAAPLVFTLDRTLGGAKRVAADLDALREAGGPAVPAPAIVERPSAERFAAAFADFSRAAPTPLLLAPTTLANLADRSRVATVEVSFPRCRDHALAPQPLCGFAGLAVLAGRIVNAVGRVT